MSVMTSRVVLGGLALGASHVFSVRQRMSLDSTSVSSVVAEISALIQDQQGGAEVHKLIQQIAEKATPGADADYKNSMKAAIAAIEAEVEPKILASHRETQRKLDEALSAFKSQADSAGEAFAAAKDIDKTYFECVAIEQTLRQTVESAVQKAEDAKESATAACKAQEEDRSFAFDAAEGDYNFGLDCDLGDAEACQRQTAKLEEAVAKMETDLTTAMDADQKRYDSLKAVCDRNNNAAAAADSALSAAEKKWSAQRGQCANMVGGRKEAACSFGTELKSKCQKESDFDILDARSREEGHDMSEGDRVQEWKAARTAKCMLQKYMEKGLDGSVDSDLLNACNEDDDEMKLTRQDAAAQQFKEGLACADGPIRFSSEGEEWTVPEGKAPASSGYKKVAYMPVFSVSRGFGFCAKTIGEQNVGGGDGPLGPGPLPGPVPEGKPTLHLIEAGDQCGRNWQTEAQANHLNAADNTKFDVGASLASWGCDRLTKATAVYSMEMNGARFAVSYC